MPKESHVVKSGSVVSVHHITRKFPERSLFIEHPHCMLPIVPFSCSTYALVESARLVYMHLDSCTLVTVIVVKFTNNNAQVGPWFSLHSDVIS